MSTHTGWKSIKNTGQDHHSSEVWLCHQGLKPERRVGLFCLLCTSCPLPLDSGTAWVIAINPTHAGIDPKHPPIHPLPVGLYLHYFSFGTSRSADGPLWIVCDAVPSWRSTLPSVSASTASRDVSVLMEHQQAGDCHQQIPFQTLGFIPLAGTQTCF